MVRSVYYFLFQMFIEEVAERAGKIVYVYIDDKCVAIDGGLGHILFLIIKLLLHDWTSGFPQNGLVNILFPFPCVYRRSHCACCPLSLGGS